MLAAADQAYAPDAVIRSLRAIPPGADRNVGGRLEPCTTAKALATKDRQFRSGTVPGTAGPLAWQLMGTAEVVDGFSDGFSNGYGDLLYGSYDCVDRIVLNAYYRLGHNPGGFRTWWRRLHGNDAQLDNAHLMRMAGRFARRVRTSVPRTASR